MADVDNDVNEYFELIMMIVIEDDNIHEYTNQMIDLNTNTSGNNIITSIISILTTASTIFILISL